ncbi:MAG TPA: hypothetical protein VM841_10820 [Actinomycetota bacterium]|nr:hypothetical protein [Actinomycetota bacterium]
MARTAGRRSANAFLRQVADELPNWLPPAHRGYASEHFGRCFKVWYDAKPVHFEVQFLRNGRLEIAFHMESDLKTNTEINALLERKQHEIRLALGDEPEFFAHGPKWRALREVWSGGNLRSEEAAVEASARLADYVKAIRPLIPPPGA